VRARRFAPPRIHPVHGPRKHRARIPPTERRVPSPMGPGGLARDEAGALPA